MPLPLPRTLGPYLLEQLLGEGGMAEVFKARAFGASGFEKTVVLKVLKAELQGDGQFERMFIEEARLQARLIHRNLVQAHDLGTADGAYFVRLDFVDGAALSTLTGGGPMPLELAVAVGAELALALDFVHRATDEQGRPLGLVHRDVSPSNVLLSREGEVKLADFGIAKATRLKEQTRGGVRKGTFGYMSPEQLMGRPLSQASDQFSLAVMLTELITGRRPFDAGDDAEPVLAQVDLEAVRAVLRRALAQAPGERYLSAAAFREALLLASKGADVPELAVWSRSRLHAHHSG